MVVVQDGQSSRQVFVDHLAVGDQDSAIDAAGLVGIVCDDDDRLAARRQLREQGENGVRGLGVEIAGGFIGYDQRRVIGQGAGDGGALLLPTRHGPRQLTGLAGQVDLFEQMQSALAAGRPGIQAVEFHRQDQVLQQRQGGQELEELEDDAEMAPAPARHRCFVEGGE